MTAVERFDFLVYFRLGTFHMNMNKVIQDLGSGMKYDVNVDDILSYGYFRTKLGLHHISNDPGTIKKDGNFESHSQFCEDIGIELILAAFRSFLTKSDYNLEKSQGAAADLIMKFLKDSKIKYFYDPDNNRYDAFDDMEASCLDIIGRTIISLVQNAVEHEGDFLNRKEDHQDSKYAPRLLFNRIWFLQASE